MNSSTHWRKSRFVEWTHWVCGLVRTNFDWNSIWNRWPRRVNESNRCWTMMSDRLWHKSPNVWPIGINMRRQFTWRFVHFVVITAVWVWHGVLSFTDSIFGKGHKELRPFADRNQGSHFSNQGRATKWRWGITGWCKYSMNTDQLKGWLDGML